MPYGRRVVPVVLLCVFGKAVRLQPRPVHALKSKGLAGKRTEGRQVAGGPDGPFQALGKARGLQGPI